MEREDRSRAWARPTPLSGASLEVLLEGAARAVTVAIAGGAFLTLVAGLLVPTAGGRRSARLKWEERRQEIKAAAGETPPR
jgi:hypothetical protein